MEYGQKLRPTLIFTMMIFSTSLSELLQSTVTPPDAVSDFGLAMRELRMAEAELRFAVEVVELARAPGDRSRAMHMRDDAMRGLIIALERVQLSLRDTP